MAGHSAEADLRRLLRLAWHLDIGYQRIAPPRKPHLRIRRRSVRKHTAADRERNPFATIDPDSKRIPAGGVAFRQTELDRRIFLFECRRRKNRIGGNGKRESSLAGVDALGRTGEKNRSALWARFERKRLPFLSEDCERIEIEFAERPVPAPVHAESVEPATGRSARQKLARHASVELVPSLVVHVPEIHREPFPLRIYELGVDRDGRRRRVTPEHVVAEHPTADGVETVGDRHRYGRPDEYPGLVLAAERTVPETRHAVAEKETRSGASKRCLRVVPGNPPPSARGQRTQGRPVIRRPPRPVHLVRTRPGESRKDRRQQYRRQTHHLAPVVHFTRKPYMDIFLL